MNQDFLELLRELSAAKVQFLVVGAYAVAYHGEPRATGDLDIWVDASPQNAKRVFKALAAFGAPLDELTEEDLASPGVVFQMGVAPRRIDVLTSVTGLRFEEAWPHRVKATYGDVAFPLIGRDQLIQNKKALARPKDLLDLDILTRHKPR